MIVIGLTGLTARGAAFAALCDHALIAPHAWTPRIQEGHVAMGHAFCELVERSLFDTGRERSGKRAARGGAARARRR